MVETVSVSVTKISNERFKLEVGSNDFIGLFSIVAGLVSSYGLNIIRGVVETEAQKPLRERKVLISLEVEAKQTPDWQALKEDLNQFFGKSSRGLTTEVQKDLNARIISFFRNHQESYLDKLYPIQLNVHQDVSTTETVIDLKTQDTMAFLYELTSALSALDINITKMQIETKNQIVEDRLWLTTSSGEKINSSRKLKELRWAILLVKQFTHLLPKVPDPAVAMDQISSFGKELFARADFEEVLLSLEKGETLRHLSKIFGSSKFLWEEFIRTQHESLIPLLDNQNILKKKRTKLSLKRELIKSLRAKKTFESKVEALNAFKDQEMFRIDLRHLLRKTSYLEEFAEEFSDLAEMVVEAGYHLAWDQVAKECAEPMASTHSRSDLAILGLGKFGGRELGYASDMELLFVYTDDKDSASERSQKNLHFYTELVKTFRQIIWTRSEGVFEIDLRLRPHGSNGPLAASLDLFKSYYSAKGESWSYERQALVKMRAVAGSPWLGKEIERLRDEYVYGNAAYDFNEAIRLRTRQKQELVPVGNLNAKYSAGGLLDIEYLVQVLQIAFGAKRNALRQTNTLKALRALWQEGVLEEVQFQELRAAYVFIRDLINALRIFRGNAKDLNIPKRDELEFITLGRRMGFQGTDEIIKSRLESTFTHHMQNAARFYQTWMDRLSTMKWEDVGTMEVKASKIVRASLDEILREEPSAESIKDLEQIGFRNVQEAVQRFKRIYPGSLAFEQFARAFDQLWHLWPQVPDPDLALKHFERLAEVSPDAFELWKLVSESEEGLETLLSVFGQSIYLSELIITHPEFCKWVLEEKNWNVSDGAWSISDDWSLLRKLRHQETLRIGICDIKRTHELSEILRSFSMLSEWILKKVFSHKQLEKQFCVLGLGKLGGEELNFSSDVDLMFVSLDAIKNDQLTELTKHIETAIHHLTAHSGEGFLYRVDLRLKPHGHAGALVMTLADTLDYYRNQADSWERQMLIKARPVAGNLELGKSFIDQIEPLVYGAEHWQSKQIEQIREVKRRYEAQTRSRGEEERNIKMGLGGIRDLEFIVQMIQMQNAETIPALKLGNHLSALKQIRLAKLLNEQECKDLENTYVFLRRIENKLHLYENRQTFLVPENESGLRRLARSLDFQDTGAQSAEEIFKLELKFRMSRARTIFERVFYGS